MSTSATIDPRDTLDDEALEYRAIHFGAILGLVLGALSVFVLLAAPVSLDATLMICPIPVLGMFLSLRAWSRIRQQPDHYTGGKLALIGLALSLGFLVTGVSYAGYVYSTEVPDGYERISFAAMRPTDAQQRDGIVVPPEIAALAGKHVFIKGYIRPGSTPVRTGIDDFLLVRDNNNCCFGDISSVKYYDQIAVDMTGAKRVDYGTRIFRMGGTLEIHPEFLAYGPGYPVFSLKADYAN